MDDHVVNELMADHFKNEFDVLFPPGNQFGNR